MTADDAACAAWIAEALPAQAAAPWRVLGRGLWGPTVDLGDGTVLKLVRRAAGIGDGLDIAANEARVLAALAGQRFEGFAIPTLVAHGRFGERDAAAAAGYGAWLQLTRVRGFNTAASWPAEVCSRSTISGGRCWSACGTPARATKISAIGCARRSKPCRARVGPRSSTATPTSATSWSTTAAASVASSISPRPAAAFPRST